MSHRFRSPASETLHNNGLVQYSNFRSLRLLNYLVGAAKEGDWQRDAKRLCGVHVDHQLNFRRLLDRQVGGLLTVEDAADVDADLAIVL
jgi:hypothetical protein